MRFKEFKSLISEASKPSMMTLAQLEKGNGKYIDSIADAVAREVSLNFFIKNQYYSGVIRNAENVANEIQSALDPSRVEFEFATADGEIMQARVSQIIKDEVSKGAFTFNLGNVAEAIMGSAMTAKFEKEGGKVTVDDIKDVGVRLFQNEGKLVSQSGKDSLSFTMTVPSRDKKALASFLGMDDSSLEELGVSDEKINDIERMYRDAATYVNNSKRAQAAVDKAAADPNQNNVEVLSDGGNAEKQSITKVDLEILYDGQKINLISLKAGNVKQIGQESGAEFATLSRFFQTTVGIELPPEMANDFLPKTDPNYRDYNYSFSFPKAYDYVYRALTRHLNGDESRAEYDIVKAVYDGIHYHGTRGEQGVILLVLSPNAKKAYNELTLGKPLLDQLANYDLDVNLKKEGKNYIIEVFGTAKTEKARKLDSKSRLVQFRSYKQETAVRNAVEIGDLLKDLADLEKIDARMAQQPHPQQTPQKQPSNAKPPKSDELDQVKKLAGVKQTPQPVTQPSEQTPGQFNQNVALKKSKVPMAATSTGI